MIFTNEQPQGASVLHECADLSAPHLIAFQTRPAETSNLLVRRAAIANERRFAAEPVLITGWGSL